MAGPNSPGIAKGQQTGRANEATHWGRPVKDPTSMATRSTTPSPAAHGRNDPRRPLAGEREGAIGQAVAERTRVETAPTPGGVAN